MTELKNLDILLISSKSSFQKSAFPEKHLAEETLSRMCIFLSVHLPEFTFFRKLFFQKFIGGQVNAKR